MGEFSNDQVIILEAIALHRQALEVFTRDANPRMWAIQLRCISSCYAVISDITNDIAAAEEAKRLMEEAATADIEYTAASVSGHRMNYGRVLFRLGHLKEDLGLIDQGVALVEESRTRFDALGMDWQVQNAANALNRFKNIRDELAGSGSEPPED